MSVFFGCVAATYLIVRLLRIDAHPHKVASFRTSRRAGFSGLPHRLGFAGNISTVQKGKEMMNKILGALTLALAFVVSGCAHMEKNMSNEEAALTEVVELPGVAKDEIFVRANSWMVDTFVKADSVVEYSDKQAGVIKGKYVSDTTDGAYLMRIKSVITIEVKDGKARFSLRNPMQTATGSMLGGAPYNNPYAPVESRTFFDEKVKPQFAAVIASFKEAVQKNQSSW